jgi:heat shock protein HslJ
MCLKPLTVALVFGASFMTLLCGCGAPPQGKMSGATEPSDAAAPSAEEPAPRAEALVGAWLLEDLAGRGVVDGVQTTIAFEADGRVSGSGGCNRFTGSYSFAGGRLEFGPLASTKMMCPEPIITQEDEFLRALEAIERVEPRGATLTLHIAGADAPLRLSRMAEDIEL